MTAPSYRNLSGIVAATNPKGLRLNGSDEWLNYSKWADAIAPVERGQSVTLQLDQQGFIRSCVLADGQTSNGHAVAPVLATKDRTITRLAVLKAAAEFGASRPDLKSGDVLRIAESWVRWVLLNPESDDDLTDAF
jgi:hypothetical protein